MSTPATRPATTAPKMPQVIMPTRPGSRRAPPRSAPSCPACRSAGREQVLLRGAFLAAHHEDADDGQERCRCRPRSSGRPEPPSTAMPARRPEAHGRAQGGGGEDRAAVGLVEVGAHAGHVADVVADVVGDGRRVAGSSSGMPASTLPTRSAPTSAALV
jgi:hypothetical protein